MADVSQLAYNEAVQRGAEQEVLLNLVRLRYTEAPEFLAVSSISSQMSIEGRVDLGLETGEIGGARRSIVTPGVSLGYAERPTVSFTPERGTNFTRQLVAPISLDSLYLLSQYGWDAGRVARLVLGNVNGLSNGVGREDASGSTLDSVTRFASMASLLGRLHADGSLSIEPVERLVPMSTGVSLEDVSPSDVLAAARDGYEYILDEETRRYELVARRQHYVLRVVSRRTDRGALEELLSVLALDSGIGTYEIDLAGAQTPTPERKSLRVRTRSVLGAMAYLAQAVLVPNEHLKAGLANDNGAIAEILSDLLRIDSSFDRPENASLAIAYRGYWFFVRDDDLSSKRTLGLLSSLVRLEIDSGGGQSIPVLTLPIGR